MAVPKRKVSKNRFYSVLPLKKKLRFCSVCGAHCVSRSGIICLGCIRSKNLK